MIRYTVLDLETQTNTLAKRKASPYHPANYVVMAGWKSTGDATAKCQRWANREEQTHDVAWFLNALKTSKLLVGQNIKFDLQHLIYNSAEARAAYVKWTADGGLLWDTQLAEYLLRGMTTESMMMSLDELAPEYGGVTKVDEVKLLWDSGVQTADIDPALLRRYLIGDDGKGGDIGNTELVFLGQYELARQRGQVMSIILNCGSLACSTEMEVNGMKVDTALGYKLAEEMATEVEELQLQLRADLPPDLPFEFNWGSARQKSALLFGGTVTYDARVQVRDEDGNLVYFLKDETHYLLEDGTTMECTWWEHCLHTEWMGSEPEDKRRAVFAGGKNKGEFKTKKVKRPDTERGPKTRLEKVDYEFPRMVDPLEEWATATPGQYKTGADVLIALGDEDIPFLQTLGRLTALTKDLTTYYVATDDKGNRKGMLTLVNDDDVVHASINHTNTVTGRFSCSDPNL